MARPKKLGLDYFDLDCQMDDKIKLIQAEFGLNGFAVVIKLYQLIYSGFGYYCEWDNDRLLLFVAENSTNAEDKELIKDIVNACIKRKIFSESLFDKYSILTSAGIQKRYMNAVSKRGEVNVKKEYMLINNDDIPSNVKVLDNGIENTLQNVSVEKTRVLGEKTRVFSADNPQSRVEKSRVEKSIYKTSCAKPCDLAQQQESRATPKSENDNPDRSLKITTKGKAALTEKENDSQIAKDEKVIISLPLNTGELYPFTDKDIEYYKELYPAVDVMQELRSMLGWFDANPTRKKTKTGIKRFVNSWISKAQNSARGNTQYYQPVNTQKKNSFNNFPQRNDDLDAYMLEKLNEHLNF